VAALRRNFVVLKNYISPKVVVIKSNQETGSYLNLVFTSTVTLTINMVKAKGDWPHGPPSNQNAASSSAAKNLQ